MDLVEHHLTLPTDLDAAWDLLTRPEDLAAWLGAAVVLRPTPGATGRVVDHDSTQRLLVVDEVEEGRRLAWRWWIDGEGDGDVSRVEITLAPVEGGTEVRVVETVLPAATLMAGTRAGEAWSHRLLHLEALLLVAAAVRG